MTGEYEGLLEAGGVDHEVAAWAIRMRALELSAETFRGASEPVGVESLPDPALDDEFSRRIVQRAGFFAAMAFGMPDPGAMEATS